MKRCIVVVAAMMLCASSSSARDEPYVRKPMPGLSSSLVKDKASEKHPVAISPKFLTTFKAAEIHLAEAESQGGKGPSAMGIPLRNYIDIDGLEDYDGLDPSDLCRLSTIVFPDVNEDSGIYYYYPERWHLHYEPDEGGYHFRIDYKASSGGSNNVLLTAQLTPGFDRQDVEFLAAMLDEYLRVEGKRGPKPKLLPLPASPEAEFHLASWDIEEVTINAIEPDTDTIHLSISADVATKELVMNTLIHEGLPGSVSLRPEVWGDGYETLTSPVGGFAEIRLGDIAGGPRLRWPRNTSGGRADVINEWPFDLRLDYLVYLYRKPGGGLDLRGWDLGGEVLAPGDTARLSTRDLNDELTSRDSVDVRFIGRLIRDEIPARAVIESHTGGVGLLPVSNLVIDVVEADALFDQYSVYKIAVEIRSAHFDPQGRERVGKSYVLDREESLVTTDPLYLWDDPSGGDLFQYRIAVVTTDGVVHEDRAWRRPEIQEGETITVYIGASQVETVLAE